MKPPCSAHMSFVTIDNVGLPCVVEPNPERLFKAAEKANIEILEAELNAGVPADYCVHGLPLIHVAARAGHNEIIQVLIRHDANVNALDQSGASALQSAASYAKAETVRLLIQQYHAITATRDSSGSTPLISAVRADSNEDDVFATTKTLLDHESQVSSQDNEGLTALHWAAARPGRAATVRLLLERGADPAIKSSRNSEYGEEPPIFFAVRSEDLDVCKAFLDHGADTTWRNEYEETPLHTAAYLGNLDMLQLLINAGVDPTAKSRNSNTALHRAAEGGQDRCVQLLLSLGLGVDGINKFGWTPLMFAVANNSQSTAEQLIKAGADVNMAATDGWTSVHLAADYQDMDCRGPGVLADNDPSLIELLLNNGANAMARTRLARRSSVGDSGESLMEHLYGQKHDETRHKKVNAGQTPLHRAALRGSVVKASILIEHRAEVNCIDSVGVSPLHLAISTESIDMLELLLKSGARVNAQNEEGTTALHLVYDSNSLIGMAWDEQAWNEGPWPEGLSILRSFGVDETIVDRQGETGIQKWQRRGRELRDV